MKVSLLGTGLMGFPLARRILKAGHPLTVYNRTQAKARPLVKMGATLAASPREALRCADLVVLMLSDAAVIRKLLLGAPVRELLRGRSFIQMGTIGPDESKAVAAQIKKQGGDYMECPVLGSIAEIRNGKLILMFGGSETRFRHHREFLKCLGRPPIRVGPIGAAATLKLALNQLIASHIVGFSQSLALIQKSGVEVSLFMAILKQSALYAPMFEKKLPRLLKRDYGNPNFSTRNMLKDVRLFLAAAQAKGINAPVLAAARNLLASTLRAGLTDVDYSAVYEVVRG